MLCSEGHPIEFAQYLNVVKGYSFADQPDYHALRMLFRNLFDRSGFVRDNEFDWTILKRKKKAESGVATQVQAQE